MRAGLRSLKNVVTPSAKIVLMSLGLTTATSATDAVIQKKIFGLGMTKTVISDIEMNDIMKIVKSLEESGLLINGVCGTTGNKAKEQKGRFLGMLLGKLGASLLGNLLTGNRSYPSW